jgi:thymidylate synthase ThyX
LRETGDFLAINGDHIKDNIEALSIWQHLKMTLNEDYYLRKVAEVAKGDVEEAFALEWISPDDPFIVYQLAVQLMCYAEANETKKERLRGIIGDSVRCHGTVSLSLRALLHLASVRLGGDTQNASRHIVTEMLNETQKLFPSIIQWYHEQEPKKLTLAP